MTLSLALPPLPLLQHRASVKGFVSLQFLNPKTAGRIPWTSDQPVASPRTIQIQNKHTQISMPCVGFKPTTPAFERAKTIHALDWAATVIGDAHKALAMLLLLFINCNWAKTTKRGALSINNFLCAQARFIQWVSRKAKRLI
jgi:hypothetical protein